MNRKLTLALALSALLGAPLMQTGMAADWQVTQTGENFDGTWSGGPRDNLVGGGHAAMSGGGDDTQMLYTGPLPSMAPAFARMSGGGDDLTISHDAAPTGERPAAFAALGQTPAAR